MITTGGDPLCELQYNFSIECGRSAIGDVGTLSQTGDPVLGNEDILIATESLAMSKKFPFENLDTWQNIHLDHVLQYLQL